MPESEQEDADDVRLIRYAYVLPERLAETSVVQRYVEKC